MTDKPSEMVEAIARAIEALNPTWKDATAEARAALSAIEGMGYVIVPREPTEAMVDAAIKERYFWNEWDDRRRAFRAIYPVVLSAALAETGKE